MIIEEFQTHIAQLNLPSFSDTLSFFGSSEGSVTCYLLVTRHSELSWTLSKYLEKDKLWLDLPFQHLVSATAPCFAATRTLPPPLTTLTLPSALPFLLRGALLLHRVPHGTAEALQRPLHWVASFRHCTITAASVSDRAHRSDRCTLSQARKVARWLNWSFATLQRDWRSGEQRTTAPGTETINPKGSDQPISALTPHKITSGCLN